MQSEANMTETLALTVKEFEFPEFGEPINPAPKKREEGGLYKMLEKQCYFCGNAQIVQNKHFYLCPNCVAVYAVSPLHKPCCEHVVDGTPIMIRHPIQKEEVHRPFIYQLPNQGYRCADCDNEVFTDGW